MTTYFNDFDLSDFWDNDDYAEEAYISAPFTEELLTEIQALLGYTLPASYVALMRQQNGGTPVRTCLPTTEPTSWAEDHVAITGIHGIGREKVNSLGGKFGSRFWIEEWKYPDIGVYFADCPSAGHDMICLDYRHCGPRGEPQVVHVDQEDDYRIIYLSPSFEDFIRALEHEDNFTDEDI
ncbi:SMI1/KNR4 family protein [Myxococcota bacterium]|nr:SMI1/KNR4 family protein [Myxococcota bacterium]MBU1536858.1 SMI1/KNR4 family protein [Myxococcota bacterium]